MLPALQYYQQAQPIQLKAFGDVHPDTADSKYNIGLVLKATSKASEARAKFAQAAAVMRLVLGPDHPDTKTSGRGAE